MMEKNQSKKLVEDYVKAKMKLDILELDVKEKKQAVIDALKEDEVKTVHTADATVTLRETKKYEYSRSISLKEETLKVEKKSLNLLRKEEVEDGTAKHVDSTFAVVVKM